MSNTSSSVQLRAAAAEEAIKTLLASGKSVSIYAVEREAGLSNGTLNYICGEYDEIRKRIKKLKAGSSTKGYDTGVSSEISELKTKIKNEQKLKEKYRAERNALKIENEELLAKNKELMFVLFRTQQYLAHLEREYGADVKVLDFSLSRVKKF